MPFGWLLLAGASCAAAGFILFRRRSGRRDLLARFRASWGQPQPLRRRDFQAIRSGPATTDRLRLDEATWDDLDMDALFVQVDRTLTEPGQQAPHAWLRTPTDDVPALKRRSEAMRALERSAPLREDLQLRLAPLANAPQGVFAQPFLPCRPRASRTALWRWFHWARWERSQPGRSSGSCWPASPTPSTASRTTRRCDRSPLRSRV